MKKVIRNNVFETNSSTSHSLIIMSKKDYEDWENSKLYVFDPWSYFSWKKIPENKRPKNGKLYTEDEVINFLKMIDCVFDSSEINEDDVDYEKELFYKENDFFTYGGWNGDSEYSLEESKYNYTSESGDEIVIRAKYGYDG